MPLQIATRRALLSNSSDNPLRNAVLAVRASQYKGAGPLLDESGNDNDAQFGWTSMAFLTGRCLRLPGRSGHYATTPDAAALDITGDIDLRCAVALNDWTPSVDQTLVAKYTGAGARSYVIQCVAAPPAGRLVFISSVDGTEQITSHSTVAVGATDGSLLLVRATCDVNNGAAGNTVTFYTKSSSPSTAYADLTADTGWTQLGDPVVNAGTTSIFNSTAVLEIVSIAVGAASRATGRFYAAAIKNGIDGTLVFGANFYGAPWGANSFVCDTGQVVQIKPGMALVLDGARGLSLPGVASNYASVPDEAALNFGGADFDIRVQATAVSWAPAAAKMLASQYGAAGNRAWQFYLNSTGTLRLDLSYDGTAVPGYTSTANLAAVADGAVRWVRVVRVGSTIKFYTSTDYNPDTGVGTWTQLGADVVGSSSALFNSTAALEIGAATGGATAFDGKIGRSQIFASSNGTDKRLDVDFTTQPAGTQSFTCTTGQTVTVFRVDPGADTNDPLFLPLVSGRAYLYLPGIAANYASVPDAAPLQFTTQDLDMRVKGAATDWTPSAVQMMMAKESGSDGGRAWSFALIASGFLRFLWTPTGNAADNISVQSTAVITAVDGTDLSVRVTIDANNGSGQYVVTFYTSTNYDADANTGTWTQLGDVVTGATTMTIFNATRITEIGSYSTGAGGLFNGKIYRAQIFASLNSTDKRLDIDFTDLTKYNATRTSLTAVTGQTVTINRAATGRKSVVVDRPLLLLGTDDYLEIAHQPNLDFGAAESLTAVVAIRKFGNAVAGGEAIIAKRDISTAATNIGYHIALLAGTSNSSGRVADGVNTTLAASLAYTSGATQAIALKRDVVSDIVRMVLDGIAGSDTTDATVTTIASGLPLRIGRSHAPGSALYADVEIVGAAIFRSALSDADLYRAGLELLR